MIRSLSAQRGCKAADGRIDVLLAHAGIMEYDGITHGRLAAVFRQRRQEDARIPCGTAEGGGIHAAKLAEDMHARVVADDADVFGKFPLERRNERGSADSVKV